MKIVTASALGIAFLFVISFFLLKTSEARGGSDSQITRPTQPSKQFSKGNRIYDSGFFHAATPLSETKPKDSNSKST